MDAVRQAARRLFEARVRFGEFDRNGSVPFDRFGNRSIASKAHQELNLKAAEVSNTP